MSSLFASVAMLAASAAGRVGEDGSGAMWIAPELVPRAPVALECSQPSGASNNDLVFEIIIADGQDEPRLGAISGNNVFDWNPETGELVFTGVSPADVFGGLESRAASYSAASARSCGPG